MSAILYVSVHDNRIHALDAHTGALRWKTDRAGAGFDTNPLVVDGRVYAGCRDGFFYCFHAADGTLAWYLTEAKAKRLAYLNDIDPLDLSGYESGGFLWLVPELADYLRQHGQQRVQHYVDRYDWALPYWSISRAPECTRVTAQITLDHMEGGHAPYYDTWGLFNAKALILQNSRSELEDLLDVPAVSRGDLFYIHNLVSTIEAL